MSVRRAALNGAAVMAAAVGAGNLAVGRWVPAAVFLTVAALLGRLARRWPWAARWIFRREIDRLSQTGEVTRRRLWERYVRVSPEPRMRDREGPQ